jgi:hypothetical protein
MLLGLDVKNEYLLFDPADHVAVSVESTRGALKARRDHVLLFRALVLNGQLEVITTGTDERLGRTDAFVASNIDMRRGRWPTSTRYSPILTALSTRSRAMTPN